MIFSMQFIVPLWHKSTGGLHRSVLLRSAAACLVICTLLLATGASHAANNYWSRIGPFGGSVSQLKFDPVTPSNILAVTHSEVIYSRDDAATWNAAYYQGQRVRSNIIAVSPSRYYVYTTQSQLLSSTDGGQTWSGIGFPNVVAKLQVDAQDNRILYTTVVTGQFSGFDLYGIAKSRDAGLTWAMLTPAPGTNSVYDLIADPLRPGIIYAGVRSVDGPTNDAYFRSLDGGATWKRLDSGLPGGALARLSIDPSKPDTLYMTRLADGRKTIWLARSTDDGGLWQVSPTNLPIGIEDDYYAIPDPVQYGTLYMGKRSGFGIFRSTDGGTLWSEISAGTIPLTASGSVVPHSTQRGLMFATTTDVVSLQGFE